MSVQVDLSCFDLVNVVPEDIKDEDGNIITPAYEGDKEFHGSVQVTKRKSKWAERPRFHTCRKCGRRYRIKMPEKHCIEVNTLQYAT